MTAGFSIEPRFRWGKTKHELALISADKPSGRS